VSEPTSPDVTSLSSASVDERDARIRELEAQLAAQRGREAERIGELRRLHERRLRQLRESITYRVGDEVVRAARSPRRLARLPVVLTRLYRQRHQVAATAGIDLGDAPTPRRDVTAAVVLDEFTMRCFAPELRLVPLTRAGWRSQLEKPPDLLLVESAWAGNGGDWRDALTRWNEQRPNVLADIVAWCKANGVPTVFWNKEDPVNFEVFLDAARQFDHVFTTDADTIEWYRDALGHHRVYALPFAAQPAMHNPIGNRREVLPRVCFAGSWRADKYERRAHDADVLLQPALEMEVLDIFDRLAGTEGAFPPPYDTAVLGARPYDEVVDAYRRYAAFLNVNSVADSPTMFSRRVFEVLACATPVISTRARGITELLGDTVTIVDEPEATRSAIEHFVRDADGRDHAGQRGYRRVMHEHTYADRVDTILHTTNISAPRTSRAVERFVSVVCASMRPDRAKAVFEAYDQQEHRHRELVFVTNADGFDDELLDALANRSHAARVLRIDPSASLGECLNAALDVASGDYIAKWDDDDVYGAHYLGDALLPFGYADAAVVGKTSYYAYLEASNTTVLREPGREFAYVNHLAGGTIVADRAQVEGMRFATLPRGTDTQFLRDCREAGLRIFSADRFNYLLYRHAASSAHTWAVPDTEFAKDAERVADGIALDRVLV
jgi:spore maturation protein CgeB